MLYQDNYFGVPVRLRFCWRQTHCIDDQDKVQSVTDTDKEVTDWMSNTKKKAPINWHFTCQVTRIYGNFKDRYFRSTQSTSWLFENWESDSYDINDMKEKLNDFVRLHKAMQEKLKTTSYSENIQISYLGIW